MDNERRRRRNVYFTTRRPRLTRSARRAARSRFFQNALAPLPSPPHNASP
ncbi:MAG: hypothetical protein LBT53_01560 [Puniceicoccales bacterium]|nr:hypothetical protein [Puniceicoccales bacterium]